MAIVTRLKRGIFCIGSRCEIAQPLQPGNAAADWITDGPGDADANRLEDPRRRLPQPGTAGTYFPELARRHAMPAGADAR